MSNLLKSKFFLGGLIAIALLVASTTNAAYMHTGLLKMGQTSSQVMSLQQTLNGGGFLVSTTGAGSPGMESMYFGSKTKAAVMAFQAAKGLTVDGVVGAQSGAALAAMTGGTVSYPAGCTSTTGFSTTTGMSCSTGSTTLPAGCTAGAMYSSTTGAKCDGSTTTTTTVGSGDGDITNVSEISSADSSAMEGTTSEVFAFEFDVEGDVSIDRVDIYLDSTAAGTESENADDYFQSAMLMVDGKTVATLDASDWDEDSYGVVSSVTGDTDEYRLRFSGLNLAYADGANPEYVLALKSNTTIDSGDQTETWGAELETDSIRFVDGKGFSSEEGSALSETFGVDAEDVAELNVSTSSEDPNAMTIEVSDSGTTEKVAAFAFEIEEQNGVDATVDDLTITVTTAGTADEAVVVTDAFLYDGSTLLASESVPTGGVVAFENIGLDISADDTATLTVKLTFADITDYNEGDTVTVAFTSIDAASDANGNDEGDMTISGTPSGETHELRSQGISVALVDTTSAPTGTEKTFTADASGEDDQGTFTVSFAVTAFGADMYIDASSEVGGANAAGQGVEFLERDSAGTPVLSSNLLTSTTTDVNDTANVFKVEEGDTRTFTLTVIYAADTTPTDGSVEVYLESINWGTATDDTNANYYTFDLGDYKSGYLFLNGIA